MMSLQVDISEEQPFSGQNSAFTDGSKIKCSLCYVTFSHQKSMYKHVRKFHPGEKFDYCTRTINLCILCDEECLRIRNLHVHLSEKHGIELCHEKKTFYCDDDFYQWKEQIEKDTPCQFIVHRSKKELLDGRAEVHFKCNRSGVYKPSGNGKRRLKYTGSLKIGKMCPAYISMYKEVWNEAVEIQVDFQSVHVGHEVDTRSVRLTPAEKSLLAEAMLSGVPKSTILSKLQEEFSPNKRLYVTSMKDLHNIAQSFNIKDTVSLYEVEDNRINFQVQGIRKEICDTVTNASLEDDKKALEMSFKELLNKCKSSKHIKILRRLIQQAKVRM